MSTLLKINAIFTDIPSDHIDDDGEVFPLNHTMVMNIPNRDLPEGTWVTLDQENFEFPSHMVVDQSKYNATSNEMIYSLIDYKYKEGRDEYMSFRGTDALQTMLNNGWTIYLN